MKAKQGRLFEHLPMPEGASQLVRIAGDPHALHPAQRTFNRLSQELEKLEASTERWRRRIQHLVRRLHAEMLPRYEALKEAQKGLLLKLDALLAQPKKDLPLSKAKREKLSRFICMVTDSIPNLDQDPELVRLRERHLGISREEEIELKRNLAQKLACSMFGESSLEGSEEGSAEETIAYAAEQARNRRRNKKERALERTREAVDTALRENFRRLASLLHPDREQNPEERQRKTALMQRANTAFEKRDLMGLLRLQMECAQLDVDTLGDLPEERVKRYNEALKEQIATLKQEKQALIQEASDVLNVWPRFLENKEDEQLDALFDRSLLDLQKTIEHVQELSRNLDSPALHDQAIKRILEELKITEDLDDIRFILGDEDMDDDEFPPSSSAPSRRRKRKR